MGMLYKAYNIQTKEKISIKLVDVDYIFKNKGKEERK